MKKLFIFLVAIALIGSYAMAASAAEWNFYGQARVKTFWVNTDPAGGGSDSTSLDMQLPANARFGAKVKSGDVAGRIEFGSKGGVANRRLIYGTWNFGPGQLLVGQGYTPVNTFYSRMENHDTIGMGNYGRIYNGRQPMLQLKFDGFKLALVAPHKITTIGVTGATGTTLSIPKIEASYSHSFNKFSLALLGGYQTYEVEGPIKSYEVDSYVYGIGGKLKLGSVYIGANLYSGQNLGQYGLTQKGNDDAFYNSTTDAIEDSSTIGFLGVVGYVVNKSLSFETGYGQNEHSRDTTGDDEVAAYYVNAKIVMAKGVYIIPEIGKIDFKNNINGADEGSHTYYGVKWQINF